MPSLLLSAAMPSPRPVRQSPAGSAAAVLSRGVCRLFAERGYGTVVEFPLSNGRRVDVMGLGPSGDFAIVEVKASLADFRADDKWRHYLPYCERFYFAVAEDFPLHHLPDGCGLVVADGFSAAIRRESSVRPLHATRRRHQLLRFALTASERLRRLRDGGPL